MMDDTLLRQAVGPEWTVTSAAMDRLSTFGEMVLKWNPTINVVARSTIADLWARHIVDSAQVFRYTTPEQRIWLDLGSGGGFPGIVVAVLAYELIPDLKVVLVESDKRKSVFLSEVVRTLNLSATIKAERVESLPDQNADVISARALSPLADLCAYSERHLKPSGICIFLKGANAAVEVAAAQKGWQFELQQAESITDARSSLLLLRGLKHV